jgi:hypothetical protein
LTKILFKEPSYVVVGAAMEVHRTLGAGFLESVYEAALAHALALRGIPFEQQKRLAEAHREVDMVIINLGPHPKFFRAIRVIRGKSEP